MGGRQGCIELEDHLEPRKEHTVEELEVPEEGKERVSVRVSTTVMDPGVAVTVTCHRKEVKTAAMGRRGR